VASLTIDIVPCLSDNYAYLIHDAEAGLTAIVDRPSRSRSRRRWQPRGTS